jgi:processive 1,2-diacylglycerol beta-glucosyltransferase
MPNQRPLDIVFVSSPDSGETGDFVYRVRQPGRAMAATGRARVVTTSAICAMRDELVERADIVVINMVGDSDLIRTITKRTGPTVYEMSDNIFDIQPWNPVHSFFSDQHNQSCILQLITLCDRVQTTSEHLSVLFRRWHPSVTTFPNQLDSVGPLPEKSEIFTIGWGGSFGHLGDIEAVAPALTSWLLEHPEVRLHMMCDPQLFACFDGVPATQKRHFEIGPLEAYEAFLDTVDVGFVPIEERGFNLCRSDVKFLEYCAHGVVPVAARIGPYVEPVEHDVTGLLYDGAKGLVDAIEALRGDPDRVARLRAAGYAYVEGQRQEKHHVEGRLDYFEKALHELGLEGGGEGLGDLESHPRVRETSPGYFEIPFDSAEHAIYDALALANEGRGRQAQTVLESALKTEPDRLRPHVFAANGALALGDIESALSHLDRALHIEPEAFEAQLLLVFALHQGGRHDDAREVARQGWDQNPLNARLGMLHAQQIAESGATGAQIAILETVIESCPGYFVAWCALGLASFRHQRFAVARELLGRYLSVIPDNIDARFALAASELRLGRIPQGREQLHRLLELHPAHVSGLKLLERLNAGASP